MQDTDDKASGEHYLCECAVRQGLIQMVIENHQIYKIIFYNFIQRRCV